jgi:4-amino-4-deoxy-L-arabinose transferase-like glycosyltransferase
LTRAPGSGYERVFWDIFHAGGRFGEGRQSPWAASMEARAVIAEPLRRWDLAGVACYCLVLYSLVLSAGGPLTLHEGPLSQTSRQMAADHDWVIPHYGHAPWLERPPLPQWLTVGIGAIVGGIDREWVIRIGPALCGTLTVLLTTWLAARFFGRAIGLLSGLVLSTMYEFIRYATLAEADMFLTPIVAGTICTFAYLELLRPRQPDESCNFFGSRPRAVLGFFVLVGMTGLAKGLVFGTVMAMIPIAGYLLWCFSLRGILRYVWLWGWLVSLAIMLAWPLAAYLRYPDALDLWYFDLRGRLDGHYLEEPRLYYLYQWFWVVLPWPFVGLIGLSLTARPAFAERTSPLRLVWCWAILPPLAFSFAQGKHHHYMIHYLAPWAILCAVGLSWAWQQAQSWPSWVRQPLAIPALLAIAGDTALVLLGKRMPGPDWLPTALLVVWLLVSVALWWTMLNRRREVAVLGGFGLLLGLYAAGFAYKGAYLHRSREDTAFLQTVRTTVPPGRPVLLYTDPEALEGLRVLFYFDGNAAVLHHLSFLRDDRITYPEVFVVARAREQPRIEKYGQADIVLQSRHSRREESPQDRWTLFHVRLRDDLERKSGDVPISPMQAMYRVDAPNLD